MIFSLQFNQCIVYGPSTGTGKVTECIIMIRNMIAAVTREILNHVDRLIDGWMVGWLNVTGPHSVQDRM